MATTTYQSFNTMKELRKAIGKTVRASKVKNYEDDEYIGYSVVLIPPVLLEGRITTKLYEVDIRSSSTKHDERLRRGSRMTTIGKDLNQSARYNRDGVVQLDRITDDLSYIHF